MVKNAVAELEEYTKDIRKESGLKELFLVRNWGIQVLKVQGWGEKRLHNFIKRWDIRDNKGNLYPLKSHQFRATFVRELIKQKVPIAHIMEQFAHVSIEMTSHYLTLKEEEVKEIYSDMILGKDSKIAGLRAKEIKSKLDEQFRGKTEQEIDDIVSNLSKSMSFNPIPTGVCLYDFRSISQLVYQFVSFKQEYAYMTLEGETVLMEMAVSFITVLTTLLRLNFILY